MKTVLFNFSLRCDTCGKAVQCNNVEQDFVPDGWHVIEKIVKQNEPPPGSNGASGPITIQSQQMLYQGINNIPGKTIMRSHKGDEISFFPNVDLWHHESHLCDSCFNIKDILE